MPPDVDAVWWTTFPPALMASDADTVRLKLEANR